MDEAVGDIVKSGSGRLYRVRGIGPNFAAVYGCYDTGARKPGREGTLRYLRRPIEVVTKDEDVDVPVMENAQ